MMKMNKRNLKYKKIIVTKKIDWFMLFVWNDAFVRLIKIKETAVNNFTLVDDEYDDRIKLVFGNLHSLIKEIHYFNI